MQVRPPQAHKTPQKYGKTFGGEDPRMIEGDVFQIVVKIPEYTGFEEQDRKKDSEQVTEQVKRILVCLKSSAASTRELMQCMELKHRPSFLYEYLQPSIDAGLVAMTQPNSPKSPTQKYRLTSKGYDLLNKLK
jgi:ATP-dependent DNA helicase RecG